jgi:hypothetical protein
MSIQKTEAPLDSQETSSSDETDTNKQRIANAVPQTMSQPSLHLQTLCQLQPSHHRLPPPKPNLHPPIEIPQIDTVS